MEWLDNLLKASVKIQVHIPWLGYLLVSVIGGIAAYLKEWEVKNPELTFRQRLGMLSRKLFFALFAGMIWYQIIIWQGMSGSPFSYIGASLVGLYATEFLDFIWNYFKGRIVPRSNGGGHS